jgi:hypothetical protein
MDGSPLAVDQSTLTITELQLRALNLEAEIFSRIRAFELQNGQPVEWIGLTHRNGANGEKQTATVHVEVAWCFENMAA